MFKKHVAWEVRYIILDFNLLLRIIDKKHKGASQKSITVAAFEVSKVESL